MKIKYVEWGLANTFGETVELHTDLQKYPPLHDFILEHEYKHSLQESLSEQVITDVKDSIGYMHLHVYAFMLFRPKTWIQFLPFYWHDEQGFVYDISAIIIYLGMIAFTILLYYFWISI